jgi:hypothetical protein
MIATGYGPVTTQFLHHRFGDPPTRNAAELCSLPSDGAVGEALREQLDHGGLA